MSQPDPDPAAKSSAAGAARSPLDPQFQRLLDILPAAAYTCDTEGLITYYNPQAVALWGRSPRLHDPTERFYGSFRMFTSEGTPIRHEDYWMALELHQDRKSHGSEVVIERDDGSRRTALVYASPLHDADGSLTGAVNVVVDVTDRGQSEIAIARLAAIVESSDDAIVSKTLDGTIESWNSGAERLFGYSASEAIGRSITLIIPPERLDEERQILARLKRGERIEHFDTIRVAKDGRRISISLTTSPVHDSQGRVIGASKVARDVGARKEAEAALASVRDELATQVGDLRRLHEMSTRMSNTLELQPILDEALRTTTAIQGTDLGLIYFCEGDEGRLRIVASLGFDAEMLEQVQRAPVGAGACVKAVEGAQRVVIEDVERDPAFAGHREVARRAGFRAVHSTPLVTRSGRVIGVLSTHFRKPYRPTERQIELVDLCARQAVDFIENARLYTQLRDADRQKDEFMAILAHELRNPLAPVRNALEILRRDQDNPASVSQTRAMMERQIEQMVRLVDDLMDASRISRNRLVLRKEQVELSTVIQRAIELSRPQIEGAGHALEVHLPAQRVFLDADPTRLAQVFSNLLNNAAKFTPPGGHLEVRAEREGSSLRIGVRDDGAGIPPDMLSNVFEMFTQVDRSIERSQGGLGIGLSLARSIVGLHGGTLEAHSEGLGRGSEFVVHLPVLVGGMPANTNGRAASGPALPRRRILVVDDNEDSAESLALVLGLMGHEVRTAHDGNQGFASACEFRPELVFLDVGLPLRNGYEVARAIRAEEWGKSVFLVALTGWGQDEDKRRAADAGFNLHVVKPLNPGALESLLAEVAPRNGA